MNLIKSTVKIALVVSIGFVASCTEDSKPDDTSYSVPTSFNFENASYGGQEDRLNMLAEMETYMKLANENQSVDAEIIKSMYGNNNYVWTSEAFAEEQPTKDLESKTFDADVINTLIDELAALSVNGIRTTSLDGEKTYLFNENGFEPIQLISKGIMGSCFYYQGTSVYLSEVKMDVDNDITALVGPLEYTDMQHHWDESFGYFGAPTDFSIADTDGASFWAKYAKKTINGGLETIDNIMLDGFILGRAAINNEDYTVRDEAIGTIRAEWEMIPVSAALHYLNAALEDITDDALRNHELSEAIAFISALQYNVEKSITISNIDAIIAELGTNLYEVTPEMINNTRTALADAFGIANATDY
tara:strand:- start:1250 stop:2329 length:1080 start_codon:yes stop_codon:yes gene_type:complete